LQETFVELPAIAFCLEWMDKWFLLANTSQKPVGVFVLIRVATVTGVAEVDINIRCQCEARMICQLFAAIPRQGLSSRGEASEPI
jgi:hypothetical protein